MTPLSRSSEFQDCPERRQEMESDISKVRLLRLVCVLQYNYVIIFVMHIRHR